jgi:hypothetical protein
MVVSTHQYIFMKMTRLFKSPKGMALMTIVATYVIMVDINFQQRSRLLSEYNEMVARDLITEDLGGGDCDIGNPTADGNPAPEGSVKTLLASYPGSGKRFSWTIIKALTNGVSFCLMNERINRLLMQHVICNSLTLFVSCNISFPRK